ncbi:MAG TPA: TadE/TadG family type IV pilus assembly protein [Terracidiphilus sp.]|jgi:Flp pilus assembly protein TadG
MRIRNNGRSIISSAICLLRAEGGGAIVETALMMPVLITMLLGAAEFGTAAYTAIEVSNAAMAGVQYGAQTAATSGDTTGIQNAASKDAPDIALGTTSAFHTCICSDGSPSTCLSTDCSTSHIETILTVQTQASFHPGFTIPGFPATFTIRGHAVQKVMQ